MRDLCLNFVQLAACIIFLTNCVLAGHEFDAFRLIQLSKDGELFGSQSAAVSFPAVHYSDQVFRNVAVIHIKDLTKGLVSQILASKPIGIVFILPSSI